jgi:hypothetical protein
MTEDVLSLGRILRFLMELLDARHPAAFFGLLHPVTDEYDALPDIQEGSCATDRQKPVKRSDSNDQAEERKK